MPTVQIAIADRRYADQLRDLLVSDGTHRAYFVDTPNPRIDGVIVVDEDLVGDVAAHAVDRCVIIARKDSKRLRSFFQAGVRHLVFASDPTATVRLAILAAELRLAQADHC